MKTNQKILIVGGVAGGASAAARLRRLDESANIIMFEKDEYISFANCGLPYYIGGEITDKDALTLQTPESFNARFNVDVRNFNEVKAIDSKNKTVTVYNHQTQSEYQESYDKLILSMGAKPIKPKIPGIDSNKVFTLRNIPDTYKIKEYVDINKPKHAIVVGGGFIGIEMAENLHLAGVNVTIVEMSDQVITPIDYDMACEVHQHLKNKGINLALKTTLQAINDDGKNLSVTLNDQIVPTDMVIMAIGVTPETTIVKGTGITTNRHGAIIVNDKMETSVTDIYAVGDAIEIKNYITNNMGYIPLAGPANKQGRIAADNICGLNRHYHGTQGSSILKVFDLTVASSGINEKTAKILKLDYDKVYTYSANHAGYYPGAVNMSIKVLFDKKDGRILGAQIVGYDGVDKRMDVFATAIRAKMTGYDLTELELCYAPPYGSAKDPVNMAGFVIENILTNKVKQYNWNDVAALPRDGSVTLLDTRSELEYANGHIEGYINIPLDSLRSRLHELDPTKPIYVTCQVGLRGYVASRILSQNGFETYNLNGGYRLYNTIFDQTHDKFENNTINSSCSLDDTKTIKVNACGLQCPGPIVKLSATLETAKNGDIIEIQTTDPAFASDLDGYCRRTGNELVELSCNKGISSAKIKKGRQPVLKEDKNNKNMIIFSGDLDKAIASFIIANGAAAMGRKVTMFFTFWGLNIIRRPEKINVKKNFISKMFAVMMPRGSKKLSLSKMNMGGIGAKMIRTVMKNKNIDSLEDLIKTAQDNGVELIACSMSMDVMGIKHEELIDGVKLSGVATMLANGEESDMSLFI